MKRFLLLACLALPAFAQAPLPPARIAFDDGRDAMENRLFATTRTRRQINLAGFWQFRTDPANEGEAKHYFESFPAETTLWVPGTWNAQPRYSQYVGPAWLRRSFHLPAGGHLRVRFGGAFYRVKVWLDGKYLGDHEGGYTPFVFVVPNARPGTHILTVRADNTLSETTVPKRGVDWFPFGGIDRPVYAEIVPDTWIEAVDVVPTLETSGSAKLAVRVRLRNIGPARTETIRLEIDGTEAWSGTRTISTGESAVIFAAALPKPKRWSPAEPNLYSARVVLGADADDQFTRFGVRSIRVDGPRILLNGERFRFMGVNRHEDHPDWGSALPPHLLRQDAEIIKGMGGNAVRSHYPPSEMFLDYCDEAGLAYLEEVPAWQSTPAQLDRPEVQEAIKRAYREMVSRDANHPAVVTWSLGNEWRDPDRCYDQARALIEYARSVDSSRPIMLVNSGYAGRLQELVDVIGTNWGLYEWYDPANQPEDALAAKTARQLRRIHELFPNKPVVLTEFGGAESQAGWHDWGATKWSEEFQARNVAGSGAFGLTEDWISGGCVWQFSDARTSPDRTLTARLHGWNGKGILDGYRKPKLAYYELLRVFRSEK